MDSLNVSLTEIAFFVIGLYILYASLLFFIGGTREREEARNQLFRAFLAGVMFAAAMLATVFVGFATKLYVEATGIAPNCLAAFDTKAFDIWPLVESSEKALDCASNVFKNKFNNITSAYAGLFGTTTLTGLFGVTSPFSMGLFQVAMPFSGAANGALISLATAYAASKFAMGLILLAGLAAVLIMIERLEALGAVLLGAAMAMPPALAAYADYIANIKVDVQAWNFGSVLNAVMPAADIAAAFALAISLAGAIMAAISYAFSKIPERLSVE
ncbi:MAG: hypothetical protein QW680_10100 [Pyrobaculum sp.]